ncbi:FkbM family methyltransferase [Govanella unica]|uniref:FkbM family methyltransferase n=1 Tax=Govanella unica TaxID=2975056 RepID=A0A9X3TX27_9PROT|nr:FkbM family methyltransferase [Govania unica]MDA5193333.1 FkbM family methyltransferase [Govania unica]
MKCYTQDFIQSHIIYFGEWEPNLTAFLKRRLKPGDTFIDIGANIGYFSLLAAKLVQEQGKVLAIDASPSIFDLLVGNLQLNRIETVRSVHAAVTDYEGTITLYKAGKENIGASTTVVERSHQTKRGFHVEAEVPCAPLTSIATPEELSNAKLIKIDVEGAEAPILKDILKNIDRFHPEVEIIAEISQVGNVGLDSDWESLFDDFAAAGFEAYDLLNDYSLAPYIDGDAISRPEKIKQLPTKQFDVVFSRRSADML